MSAKQHQECYGGMVPDFEHLRYNRPTEGKAFGVFIENIGVGTQRRELTLKPDGWEGCVECPDYRTCYDLSMAKLALSAALVSETERMAREAGLTDIVLNPKAAYVDGMVDWQDPLYQKIIANLPAGTKASDYITSLEVTALKPGAGCCGEDCCGASETTGKGTATA